MSLRRPSLKNAAIMLLLAAGIVLGVALIFRGAGAPIEPARAVLPGTAAIELSAAGHYIILTEQVLLPRPTSAKKVTDPALALVIRREGADGTGAAVPVEPTGWTDVAYKILVRGRGRTLGHVNITEPGTYRVTGEYTPEARASEQRGQAVLAFARPASPGRLLWLLLGFGGQIVFSARFLVQWLASEKAGRSTIPRAFWYLSLAGGLMILGYAAYTRDPVFIAGYLPTALIYVRNLMLLSREDAAKKREAAAK